MTKTSKLSKKVILIDKTAHRFRILVIVICLIFVIWNLEFHICLPLEIINQATSNFIVLFTYLSTAEYYKFGGSQFLQPHGSEGMQFGGADADFGTESQLSAVIKAR